MICDLCRNKTIGAVFGSRHVLSVSYILLLPFMKHYLHYVEDSIKSNWDKPAITNYGAGTYTFAEVAANVMKMHLFFEKCGIKEGDHIAIAARNSAEWCIAFLAITSYKAIAVPLLPDFMPENMVQLTKLSDSRMLFVDSNILSGLQRAELENPFGDINDFVGVVDIV